LRQATGDLDDQVVADDGPRRAVLALRDLLPPAVQLADHGESTAVESADAAELPPTFDRRVLDQGPMGERPKLLRRPFAAG
jgi:hypothetical protein